MRVAGIRARGEPVEILEVDEPTPPAEGEVLIDVAAAGIGNWDELVRIGSWQVGGPAPMALGTEAAGTVVAVGSGVTEVREGDEVMTHPLPLRRHGTWADKVLAPAATVALRPRTASWETGAAGGAGRRRLRRLCPTRRPPAVGARGDAGRRRRSRADRVGPSARTGGTGTARGSGGSGRRDRSVTFWNRCSFRRNMECVRPSFESAFADEFRPLANSQVHSRVYGNMRTAAVVVATLAICLGVAAPRAGAGWPPWSVLSSGGAVPVPGGGDAGAVIIASQKALAKYTPVALVPGGYPPHGWQTFDWTHNLVLLVVARHQSAFPEVVGLVRRQATLRIVISSVPANPSSIVTPTWTALRVSRRVIGKPFPKYLIVMTAQPAP